MKKQSTLLFIQMSTEQVKNLTTIVKETLATHIEPSNKKIFTAADLWNIQRQGKRSIQRRFLF